MTKTHTTVICYIMLESLLGNEMLYNLQLSTYVAHSIFLISNNLLETISNHFDLFLINKDDNQHVFQSCIGSVNMEAFMANTMSTDCFRKKVNTILKQFLTSL